MSLSIAAISFAYSTVSLAWTEELGTKANVCKMDDHRNISHHVSTTLNDHGDTRYKTHPKRGSKQNKKTSSYYDNSRRQTINSNKSTLNWYIWLNVITHKSHLWTGLVGTCGVEFQSFAQGDGNWDPIKGTQPSFHCILPPIKGGEKYKIYKYKSGLKHESYFQYVFKN